MSGTDRRQAITAAARRMAKVIEELPNTSDEEKAVLKKDLHSIGVNALSTADHDVCDSCGKHAVVTDVWMPDDHPVHGFVEWVPKCRADRQCMAKEHDRNCPQAIALELAAERRKNRRDHCDSCGKHAVVTDVWIEGTPMTLCQPCVLAALTAEGESLGQYWEIEP